MAKREKELGPRSVAVLKLIAEGHTYEQILSLHPDLTYLNIFDAAREALEVTGAVRSAHEERIAEIRKAHPRAYEPWTDEEDATLAQLVRSGQSIEEIATKLQRQPSAVRGRMRKRSLV
jgi:DNA-binding NarL/FixJ family response regulator